MSFLLENKKKSRASEFSHWNLVGAYSCTPEIKIFSVGKLFSFFGIFFQKWRKPNEKIEETTEI